MTKQSMLKELRQVIGREVRKALVRETPNDVQFVELTGALKQMGPSFWRDETVVMLEEFPIILQSMEVDDPEDWSERTTHDLYLEVDFDANWDPGDRSVGVGAGYDIDVEGFTVIGVDGYTIEDYDAAKVKAYIASRGDLIALVDQQISAVLHDRMENYEAPEREYDDWDR